MDVHEGRGDFVVGVRDIMGLGRDRGAPGSAVRHSLLEKFR
jgi:hypothetical protein